MAGNSDNVLTLAFFICSAAVWRRKGPCSTAHSEDASLGGEAEAPTARLVLPRDASAPTSLKLGTDPEELAVGGSPGRVLPRSSTEPRGGELRAESARSAGRSPAAVAAGSPLLRCVRAPASTNWVLDSAPLSRPSCPESFPRHILSRNLHFLHELPAQWCRPLSTARTIPS
jgi:hypothetical protein